MFPNQKVRITLVAFDHKILDEAAKKIVSTVERTGSKVSGPIPLPNKDERFTVNRSPHVNKKSREHFAIRTHKRVIVIVNPQPETVAALEKIELKSSVYVQVKVVGAE